MTNFSSVTLTFHVHATENKDRILEVLDHELSIAHGEIEEEALKGHFGNQIIRYNIRLLGEAAQRLAKELFRRLDETDKKLLALRLEEHVDEHGALYVRIDKQLLFEGKLGFSDTDAIRVKLKPKYKHKPKDIVSSYRKMIKQ